VRVRLIRHGQTAGNRLRRYIGVTDQPLSPEGIEAASRCAKDPALDRVWVSPLTRARETAAILFPNARQIVIDGLREMDFGAFENRSADEMRDDPAYRAWVDGMCRAACPGGESMADLSARAAAAFADLLRQADGDVTIVTHGGVIMAILSQFAVPKKDFYDWYADNLAGFSADCRIERGVPVLSDIEPLA
jgi:alpha-ribazole phosphatase